MNEMRKLMETVSSLFEEAAAGFLNVKVGVDRDDMIINGEDTTADYIYIYNNADWETHPLQTTFAQEHISDEDYEEILNSVVPETEGHIRMIMNKEYDWLDGIDLRSEYIAISSEVHPAINDKLVKDVIARTMLSQLEPATTEEPGVYAFKINRKKKDEKKKRWWSR